MSDNQKVLPQHFNMVDAQNEAMEIEGQAWLLIKAFDDLAEGIDRRIPYAAFILMMTSFIKTSEATPESIIADFCFRVRSGVYARAAVKS